MQVSHLFGFFLFVFEKTKKRTQEVVVNESQWWARSTHFFSQLVPSLKRVSRKPLVVETLWETWCGRQHNKKEGKI